MINPDLQEATLTMALLMKKEATFYNEHLAEDVRPTDATKLQEYLRQFEYLKANTREFSNRMAAHPQFFDVMESWIVCISGKEGVGLESLNMASKTGDIDDLLDRTGGLAQSVRNYLRDNNYMICEMGAGAGGWDVETRCTEKVSRVLCRDLITKFQPAINYGLLFVSKRFGEHRFPGLYNWDDALRLLKAYGEDLPAL